MAALHRKPRLISAPPGTAAKPATAARHARMIPTGRFPYKGVAFKGLPLSGENAGASLTGGIAKVDAEDRPRGSKAGPGSRANRAGKSKPIVISRILAAHKKSTVR
jgi:hypothetical protein